MWTTLRLLVVCVCIKYVAINRIVSEVGYVKPIFTAADGNTHTPACSYYKSNILVIRVPLILKEMQ